MATADDKQPTAFTVSMDSKEIACSRTGEGRVRLIFTHGAGGTIKSDSIANFAAGFSRPATSSIICFQGNMNLKSRVKMFDAVHNNAINTYKHEKPIALGGRSMGARAAVLAAMEDTKCLILASYPLQTDKEVRDQILLDLNTEKDVLFISGDHDSMCDLDRLNAVRKRMKARTWLIRVRDGDHGMNVKQKKATKAIGIEAGKLAEDWLETRKTSGAECEIWWEEDEYGKGHVCCGAWVDAMSPDDTELKLSKKRKPNHEEGVNIAKKPKAPPSRPKNSENDEGSPELGKEIDTGLPKSEVSRFVNTKAAKLSQKETESAMGLRRSKRKKMSP